MRVIAGIAKNRRLKSIPGLDTRPTTDRIKESLFNIIGPDVPDTRFLDLYAGNGGIGIEALSRGASLAVFIEQNPKVTRMIRENLEITGLNGEVYTKDVMKAISILRKKQRAFDFIFMDPPYYQGMVARTLEVVAEAKILAPGGTIITEYGKKEEIPSQMLNLSEVRKQVYGDTVIGFYKEDSLED